MKKRGPIEAPEKTLKLTSVQVLPKQGKQSVDVARQWCGRLGKTDNCQVTIYMAYVSRKDQALVNTRLYLPKE